MIECYVTVVSKNKWETAISDFRVATGRVTQGTSVCVRRSNPCHQATAIQNADLLCIVIKVIYFLRAFSSLELVYCEQMCQSFGLFFSSSSSKSSHTTVNLPLLEHMDWPQFISSHSASKAMSFKQLLNCISFQIILRYILNNVLSVSFSSFNASIFVSTYLIDTSRLCHLFAMVACSVDKDLRDPWPTHGGHYGFELNVFTTLWFRHSCSCHCLINLYNISASEFVPKRWRYS